MFSPETTSQTRSLRPKRTRQTGSDDSLKLPQAKRKRSVLRKDTFQSPTQTTLNEFAGRDPHRTNGHAVEAKPSIDQPSVLKDLTLRGGKKTEKRSERGSGALTLSSNDFYTVTQLPSLPDQIRNRPTLDYTCTIHPDSGYALALTHTDALIWPYNSSASSPAPRDLITFQLPFSSPSAADPLPLAGFTAKSAGGEPGIVVVSPKCGKIAYWETIMNASSFVPGQTSSGVQGSVPAMLSGETVREIISAEPSGFILTFSHGRVAHLTLRDQLGRPGIGVQFLRKSANGSGGGLFGSIRNVFGGDRRKGTPIARAGRASKGQRDVVIGTEDGEIELWNVNLGSGNTLTAVLRMNEALLEALKHNLPDKASKEIHLKVLDFELSSGPSSDKILAKQNAQPITFLVTLSQPTQTAYYIVEAAILEDSIAVNVVHPIKCYNAALPQSNPVGPRLCIPKPRQLAFVVFESAVVLFSLVQARETPSSQIMRERHALPEPFQDCIRFQENSIFRVLGFGVEDQNDHNKNPAVVTSVQGFGLVRVTSVVKPTVEADDADDNDVRISPKSKLEQAVFFGTIRQNPLDLTSSTAGQAFTSEEIEEAALEISSEILSSSSKYLPKSSPSIDGQMKLRAKAHEDLANHLFKHYPDKITRVTRWKLLWDAEKLAAAQAIWKVQEGIQRHYQPMPKDRTESYLQFALCALHEGSQTYPDKTKGQTDRVRHWLIHDVQRIELMIAELVGSFKELHDCAIEDPHVFADYFREADDIWVAAYEAAFRFREDNAPIYGLGDEVFKDGVLFSGYNGLPDVWTSSATPLHWGEQLIFDNCELLGDWWRPEDNKKMVIHSTRNTPLEGPTRKQLDELAQRLPKQAELVIRLIKEDLIQVNERIKAQEPNDPDLQAEVLAKVRAPSKPRIRTLLTAIAQFNPPGTIALAETISPLDPGLLVNLNTMYLKSLAIESTTDSDNLAAIERKILDVQAHAETYFDRFGENWAFAHFSRRVRDNDLAAMLTEAQAEPEKKQRYLTKFFRTCQKIEAGTGARFGKISWINDVIGDQDYRRAELTLERVANEEVDMWSKRTELAMAKLAALAANEVGGPSPKPNESKSKSKDPSRFDNALKLLDIQELVYEHVVASIGPTIDVKAAQDVGMEIFGQRVVEGKKTLRRLLKNALDVLLEKQAMGGEQLIDLLTLMDPFEWAGPAKDDPKVMGAEFALALNVVDLATDGLDGEKESGAGAGAGAGADNGSRDNVRREIWRRAMIRDDWLKLNETSLKDDRTVERAMRMSSLFRTLVSVMRDARDEEVPSRLFSPTDILEHSQALSAAQAESARKRLVGVDFDTLQRDLDTEHERLQEFINKAQLEAHYGGLVVTAQHVVRREADADGDAMALEALGDRDGNANGDDAGQVFDADLEVIHGNGY